MAYRITTAPDDCIWWSDGLFMVMPLMSEMQTYQPIALKAWYFLSETAIQTDGSLGYVQPIGEKAIPGQVADAASTADFGVGAFLLAAAEMARCAAAK